jgi:hypothetical protein
LQSPPITIDILGAPVAMLTPATAVSMTPLVTVAVTVGIAIDISMVSDGDNTLYEKRIET